MKFKRQPRSKLISYRQKSERFESINCSLMTRTQKAALELRLHLWSLRPMRGTVTQWLPNVMNHCRHHQTEIAGRRIPQQLTELWRMWLQTFFRG
ncbi:hypothetical protein AAFF_G00347030 [Aldrovandia affinis]|uniref:Uncharacterized protein n=1 Tax=Aldrovandia affinis TaxID=143900 RepID=A0AAD7SJK4_9TELE|nr:hypothetical protein AAFF_G00347030 [Aldrovandia affinis]